jgi:ubiquinone/menaquinone biosynthesis C-methylase UbiE
MEPSRPSERAAAPFSEAADFYRNRAPYAPRAFELVRATFGLGPGSRLLDLGCGPGTIAIPLSQAVGYVLAVDPSEAMLAAGRQRAAELGRTNIEWLRARAEDIDTSRGDFDVVTLGQSFHWMDRDEVLRRLTAMVATHGGVALINPGKRRPQESWETLADEIIARYLGPRPRHAATNPEPHNEPALLRSPAFAHFRTHEFAHEFRRDVPSIIGHVYSLSTSPRSAFGQRAAAFERELTAALLRSNPSGVFEERIETAVTIARKISDAGFGRHS